MTRGTGRLAGRRILITGAASGIGRETAALFAKEGAQIALVDNNATQLEEAAHALGATSFRADVSDEASVNAAATGAAKAMGGIDGLVNAAGIFALTPLDDSEMAQWTRVLDINVLGSVRVSRAALPWLRKASTQTSNPAPTIVNFASVQGLRPSPRAGAYVASKAAVIGLTRAFAQELGPAIRVNCVCPGTIDTPMSRVGLSEVGVDVSSYVIPRIATALEVAHGVLYLTSGESSYVTGTALSIDGGRAFH
jgi:NAD(P)-dependent dehydrogenase (short-subunit alcohol dehydrogenase family)